MGPSKLSPAPWEAEGLRVWTANQEMVASLKFDTGDRCEADAEFIALARNAFDAMTRRGWGVGLSSENGEEAWFVYGRGGYKLRPVGAPGYFKGADPFTPLLDADKWYEENVDERT